MLKKIGLSAAAIFALVALAKPPAAMAADRDDYGRRDVQQSRDYRDSGEYRGSREYRASEYNRSDGRQERWRGHEDRDRDRDRDGNREWR
jgi:hypothetical protein